MTVANARHVIASIVRSPVAVEPLPGLERVRDTLADAMLLFTERDVPMFLAFFDVMLGFSRY